MEPQQPMTVALAGNPNVGKSTLFNALTGKHQHTGNWAGKTVGSAQGMCTWRGKRFLLVDVPGCYSLTPHSAEEAAARDFLCFGGIAAAIIVCDATCLERSVRLALQVLEAVPRAVVCVNLLDEARRKGITVDLRRLEQRLGVPVAGTAARGREGLDALLEALFSQAPRTPARIVYPTALEDAAGLLEGPLAPVCAGRIPVRFAAMRLLCGEAAERAALEKHLSRKALAQPALQNAMRAARERLAAAGFPPEKAASAAAAARVRTAHQLCRGVVTCTPGWDRRDRRLDRLFTGRVTGFLCLFLLLLLLFWITMAGANVPSDLLSRGFTALQGVLAQGLSALGVPAGLSSFLLDGVYRVTTWVISVMLPPMAIFFPLFSLLEEFGYLPRVAFNMDRAFQACHACGKQALTMCMGIGCNAVGVMGCRILDSPRERLLAVLTNVFVPCNGRFPTMLALLTMFLSAGVSGGAQPAVAALSLSAVLAVGVLATLLASWLLSKTLLRGVPSAFVLELPPYRVPQVGKVLANAFLQRTLHVLSRAAAFAAPAGAVLWGLSHVQAGGQPVLLACADALDPIGRALGFDGVVFLSFLLSLPANELFLPVLLMTYTAGGTLMPVGDLSALHALLLANGWGVQTAVCVLLFSLMHWPCAATCMTIYGETKRVKWLLVAVFLPTLFGAAACLLVHAGFALAAL